MTGPIARRPQRGLGPSAIARSVGVLTAARQLGAIIFFITVLLMPRSAPAEVVEQFAWAYFAYLFLSSLLGFGLERLAAPWVARHPDQPAEAVVGPLLGLRVLALPCIAVALGGLLWLVQVDLGTAGFIWTVVWIGSSQITSFLYAYLRIASRILMESWSSLGLRLLQGVLLLTGAHQDWSVEGLLAAVAVAELVVAVLVLALVGVVPVVGWGAVRGLPWGILVQFTLLEIVTFLYLRVDAVVVGRFAGASDGATYTLLYRVIDASAALVTPAVLVLYPQVALRSAAGSDLRELRRMGLGLIPALMAGFAGMASLLTVALADAVPRYADDIAVLRLLLAAVPVIAYNLVALHLRAAQGDTRFVVNVGALSLVTAVIFTVPFVHWWGLTGAAIAVVLTELIQLSVLAADRAGSRWRADDQVGWVVLWCVVLAGAATASPHYAVWTLAAGAVVILAVVRSIGVGREIEWSAQG